MPAKPRYRPERDTWELVVHADGKATKRTIGRGEEARVEAQRQADKINAEAEAAGAFMSRAPGDPLPVDATMRGWFAAYRHAMAHSREQTVRGLIENHIAPFFGDRDLRTLRERDALALGTHMIERGGVRRNEDGTTSERPLAAATVRGALGLLHQVVALYVRDGLIETNHLAGVSSIATAFEERHSSGIERRDAWTREELARLIALAREHEPALFPVVVFCAYTGARRSEALGLRWDAVDFEQNRVEIRRARVRNRDKGLKGRKRRPRYVELDLGGALLVEVLQALAASRRAREGWDAPDFVFRSPRGAAWEERNFARAWDRLRSHFPAAQIRPLVFHCLRHTFATLALRSGASAKLVGELLGHTAERVTEIYNHAMRNDRPNAFLEESGPRPQGVPKRPHFSGKSGARDGI